MSETHTIRIKVGKSDYAFPLPMSEREEEEWERKIHDAQDKEKGIKLFLQKVCLNCLFHEQQPASPPLYLGNCALHHVPVIGTECCASHAWISPEIIAEHQKFNAFTKEHTHLTPEGKKLCILCKGYWPMKKEFFSGYAILRTDNRHYPDPEAFICGECAHLIVDRLLKQALGAWYNQMTLVYK